MGIPVFLASDDAYAPFVATTIASIMDHTKSEVDFYILDSGITPHHKRKINTLSERYPHFSIRYLYIDTQKYFRDFPKLLHYSLSAYNRYLIADLVPDVKKAIYLDVDIIVRSDIQEFYNLSLDGYVLGAVSEEVFNNSSDYIQRKKRLNLALSHKYFNSGVLLLDLEQWRDRKIMPRLMDLTDQKKDLSYYVDQDVLNLLFENNYKILPARYNLQIWNIFEKKISYTEWQTTILNPAFIHFSSNFKPWCWQDVPYEKEFWKYAQQTSFYEDILLMFLKDNLK